MGNAAMRKVPEDLTKCSEKQLRTMINSVIINNPWNEDEKCSEEDSLAMTIETMRQKGFRPITPKEYVEELKAQRKHSPKGNFGVRVWIPIEKARCTTPDNTPTKVDPSFSVSDGKRGREYDAMSKTDSSMHTTDSARISAFSCDSKSETYSQESIISLHLPSSRDQAVSEILKSGASDAVLSELSFEGGTDSEECATEEWPTYGNNLKNHFQQVQYS